MNFDISALTKVIGDLMAKEPLLLDRAGRAIAVYMGGELTRHFTSQTLWDDSAMPPSKAAQGNKQQTTYRTSRTGRVHKSIKKRRAGRATLIDTGVLMDSYRAEYDGVASVVMGSDADHAIFHDQGTKYIEARPVLGINPRNIRDMCDEVAAVLAQGFAS
ncbi:hypothetical protein [Ephemeroptericola cinctiostellae]|nr:hypothetical protein [Ephemeroptericola cinctiostellae]